VFTDWLLIERLARELDAQMAGSRVTAFGSLRDGRLGLEHWRRGKSAVVALDLFARVPIATLETGELEITAERGFIRTAGAALRGLTVRSATAIKEERILRFELASRSRFGVTDTYALVAELIPRFGNLLLLKDDTIVSAYKEFKPKDGRRRIAPGLRYEPPPARASISENEQDVAAILRTARPRLPQMLAASLLSEPSRNVAELLAEADRMLERAVHANELFVYRDEGKLVQAHVVPLHQFDHLQRSREPSLLPLLQEMRAISIDKTNEEPARRRNLANTLQQQRRKVETEIAAVEKQSVAISERETLRNEAQSIFATLHEVDEGSRIDAKARAASLFARYKRLGGSIVPLQNRLATLRQKREDLDELTWEVERAAEADLNDVAQAVEKLLKKRPGQASSPLSRKKRSRLTMQTKSGSRIIVGRSPIENAELTFVVARPNDLWFHARNTPGAHVILQRDDRVEPPDEDVEMAASLAAFFSKAKQNLKVEVDYTVRKHVRKRPGAAPGLVFYTDSKTVTVAPQAPALTAAPSAGVR